MMSREQLKLQGLRAYEWGRWRAAARITFVLVPAVSLCLLESRGRSGCACVAAALIAACVWLRWRDRRGFEVVSIGLRAGSVPLLAGLLFDQFGIECGIDATSTSCTVIAALFGGAAGALIAARTPDSREQLWSFITAATIAALAAILGCVRLGLVGVVGVVAGIAFGTFVMAQVARNSALPSR